ncbi:MAG: DUF4965 domain-containing protein [Bacteroidaceae bacterium]|nr:DUF4965 domain-containing protein [Bacteroidaceae bacterium]
MFAMLLASTSLCSQTSDFFTPVKNNALRLPSVPLLVTDPHYSIWTQYNHLYDGHTEHWSNHVRKPLVGLLRVDGATYRFMGSTTEPLFPLASEAAWRGRYTMSSPTGKWTEVEYNDAAWSEGAAAFGGNDDNYRHIGTEWSSTNSDIWVRRSFTLDSVDVNAQYIIIYKHDDTFELYLNGKQLVSTGYTWDVGGVTLKIDASLLRKGENVLAAHCFNTMGGAYVDFGLYRSLLDEAKQKRCVVMPTSTYYTLTCGGVDLDLVFTTPFVMKDLDLLSTPIVYVSYRVRPNDGAAHEVQFYLETSPELTVRNASQATTTTRLTSANLSYLRTGNRDQNYLAHHDDVIDWGMLYLACENCDHKRLGLDARPTMQQAFVHTGNVPAYSRSASSPGGTYPAMVYTDSLGLVADAVQGFTMIGYDDVYSIQYHGANRKGYWARNGRVTIRQRFEDYQAGYDSIMQLCRDQDLQIYEDAYASGGTKYAEICCAAYRQCIAAHKLVTDSKGNLMFMSRENNSGSFINTLDVTYPSQPLFLLYNTALAKAMLTPVFEYSALGKWTKNFANHDLGLFPKANGQSYGADMPVEESGNALILLAVIAKMDGNMDYVARYWTYLTKWADYLVEHGKDPANQLCTDDFMGQSEHNTNLAVKAIMGVASYSELAAMQGLDDVAAEYMAKAKEMAAYWTRNAQTSTGGVHFLLQFGSAGSTWSTKYNMVWDKVWGWDIFRIPRTREMAYYTGKMLTYGLPLDSRGNLVKNDWHMWAAAMSDNNSMMTRYVNPIWKFINECPTRVPITDGHDGSNASKRLFQARSVVGGYWMKVFVDQFLSGKLTPSALRLPSADSRPAVPRLYDLQGRPLTESQAHDGIFIQQLPDGTVRKMRR